MCIYVVSKLYTLYQDNCQYEYIVQKFDHSVEIVSRKKQAKWQYIVAMAEADCLQSHIDDPL